MKLWREGGRGGRYASKGLPLKGAGAGVLGWPRGWKQTALSSGLKILQV